MLLYDLAIFSISGNAGLSHNIIFTNHKSFLLAEGFVEKNIPEKQSFQKFPF